MMKKRSSGVDTGSSSVDTSPRFQRTQLTGLHGSVDTGSSSVDTRSSSQKTCLEVLDIWDSVSTHSEVVSTHSD
ncbi:hypothetical protein Taro_036545 [Colocasia esculenta]|uniref:Uncharacterized protein n=1 Tax=Colocasia esculenta TaxID=4460 RepID=A0A843W8P6_COLES|nr:hypothetical protein [Colocasia esculenta]